uniref:Glycosyltransferase family 92 protein n=1 Tax=Araucaria cunninghamii TaxID=56994 RepID=A0A0D6QZS6_ARACU
MGVGKEKDRDGMVSGSCSACMETRILMATMLVMGLLVLSGQFMPFGSLGTRSCDKLAQTFLREEASLRFYGVDIDTKELKEMTEAKLNAAGAGGNNDSVKEGGEAKEEEMAMAMAKLNTVDLGGNNSSVKEGREAGDEEEASDKRVFRPYGNAAYLFVKMGAYRGGDYTFAVVGLASKPLHVFGKPGFECEWIPKNSTLGPVKGSTYKMLPDWGYGRVYTVVVVNCTFSHPVGTDGSGGELVIYADDGSNIGKPERIVALTERENTYNASLFSGPPPYDYLYCGSSLYGNLSPQRMREWMAYHFKFFGPKTHFVFHDAGGVHEEVRKVMEPWIQTGRVTLQDIKAQEVYDGYYHNQFLIVNDCLHRYKFMAKWTFFFDVDEYLYVPRGRTLQSVLNEFSNYTQFTIEQYPMSNKLCMERNDNTTYSRDWGLEKLIFRDVKKGIRRDRKYAIQARNAYATGVHMSENIIGKSQHQTVGKIRYYHYHGTISRRDEPCKEFVKSSMRRNITWLDGTPYILDSKLRHIAGSIKKFELQQIGSQLEDTPQ